MHINREHVLSAFDRYTSAYDVTDVKVKLKIDHTYIVAEHNVDRNHSKTPADYIIGHIGFVYGLVYRQSFIEVRQQGYLDEMLDFKSDVEDTREKFKMIKETINKYIDRHIESI
ncbi:MAG: hypothetical protein IJ803_00225 [Oribacterium sp.]|nr:hypothetical protein [Oribacterium sp.]